MREREGFLDLGESSAWQRERACTIFCGVLVQYTHASARAILVIYDSCLVLNAVNTPNTAGAMCEQLGGAMKTGGTIIIYGLMVSQHVLCNVACYIVKWVLALLM